MERGDVSFLSLDPLLHLRFSLLDDMRGMQLSPGVGSPPGPPGDPEDDEGLKHLQQVWGKPKKALGVLPYRGQRAIVLSVPAQFLAFLVCLFFVI